MENKIEKSPMNILRAQWIFLQRNEGGLFLAIRHESTEKFQILATDV